MPVMGLLGVVIERFAYRPLRNAPRLAPLITAIGVSFILQNIIQIIYGPSPVTVPQVIPPTARFQIGRRLHRLDQRLHHRRVTGLHGRAATVRHAVPPGTRHALDRPGPRGGRSSWASTSTDHRPDLLHRLGACRRRGHRVRPVLRHHPVQPWASRRASRPSRRLCWVASATSPGPSWAASSSASSRSPRLPLGSVRLERGRGLRGAHHRAGVPTVRSAWPAGG